MIAAKPEYLKLAPNFTAVFNGLKKQNPDYIAHEYLNLDWDLMYFKDVVEMFQANKTDFAMTAAPIEIIETLGFAPDVQKFLNKIADPIMREQVRDYFVNRQFRKDIFVRGLRRISVVEVYEKILSTRYVLTRPAASVPMKVSTANISANLSEKIYRPLLEFLQEDKFRPKSFGEYLRRNPKRTAKELFDAAIFLVEMNFITPCQSEENIGRVKKSCERLNAYICERAKVDESINFLASPVTGMGFPIHRIQQIMLTNYKHGKNSADELGKSVWEFLSRQGQRVVLNGKPVDAPEENLRHLKTVAEKFLANELPIFTALQL